MRSPNATAGERGRFPATWYRLELFNRDRHNVGFNRIHISTVKDALGSVRWEIDHSRCSSTSLPPLTTHKRPALPEIVEKCTVRVSCVLAPEQDGQKEIAIVAPSAATSASSPALFFAPLQELAEQGFAIGLAQW
jgi:hypothetical protein